MLLNIFLALPNIFLMPLSSLDNSLVASLSPWQFLGGLIVHQHFLSVTILPKTQKKIPWSFSQHYLVFLMFFNILPWCLHGVPPRTHFVLTSPNAFLTLPRCPLIFPNILLLLENNSWCPLTFSQCSTAPSVSFMSLSMSLVLLASLLCLRAWWTFTNVKQMSKSKLLVRAYLDILFKS